MNQIPKKIYVSWKTQDIFHSTSPIIKHGLKNLGLLNSGWSLEFYDDIAIDLYLRETLDHSDYSLLENAHIVEKLDVWRLLKIYYDGGVYLDIDRLYNIPLSSLLTDSIQWVLPIHNYYDFAHDFMMSAPKNPAFELALSLYFERRHAGHNSVYFLGPQTYMHAVSQTLFGSIINTNPGVEIFKEIHKTLKQIPFIRTYNETSLFDTIVFQRPKRFVEFDHEVEKRKLYGEFDMKHWTGEW